MSERIYFLLCFFQQLFFSLSFNIAIKAPSIKTWTEGSAFGFSFAGHTLGTLEKGIFVGAPKSGTNGDLFFCPYGVETCRDIPVDVSKLARTNGGFKGALLGYSMATINESIPESVTVCAPRLARSSSSLAYITGGCFELDAGLRNPTFILPSMSICQEIPDGEKKIDLRHCTTGASVGRHSSAPDQLYMGGPYFYYAKGIGAMVDLRKYTRAHTSVDGLLPNTQLGFSMDISDRIYASVGTGRPVHVVFGGPGVPSTSPADEALGTGLVSIYAAFHTEYDSNVQPVLRLNGTQFGSRFGQSVLFVDVNNDGWEDLIVGAPYQKLEAAVGGRPEYGSVYVFLNQQGNFPHPVHDLEGPRPFSYQPESAYQILTPSGSQKDCGRSALSGYGSTLAKIGDINHDGYQDFAVGAPYAEGGGVVFVYHGTKTGRISLPTQVICTAKLATSKPLAGLGFSLGLRGMDLDQNGYADLAIGAPMSDSIVIFRTRPVVRLEAHITLPDGSTTIPENLDSLPDCTRETASISGYKSSTVRCLDLKVFMTYTSVDGSPCLRDKRYKTSLLLKYDPVDSWLHELWTELEQQPPPTLQQTNTCPLVPPSEWANPSIDGYQKLPVAAVGLLGERSVEDYGSKADRYFPFNQSASLSGRDTPGGYVSVDVEAVCRDSAVANTKESWPTPNELSTAANLKLFFRDSKMVDRTRPISIGVRWIATFPEPTSHVNDIDTFAISDPRENSQLIKLPIKNPCIENTCCPSIRVEFTAEVTRDKKGPVVFVGDDTTQTISIRARVSNIGLDPIYGLNLITAYPSDLLELNAALPSGGSISPERAICHLANPLEPNQETECTIRWLVIGHQLTVQMARICLNSTVVIGAGIPVQVQGSLNHQLQVNIKMVANVSVEGTVEPSTAYFSRNVSDGISSMTAENQLGDSRLLIKFTVRNLLRHSLIPDSQLIIDWPYEIAGNVNEPHGKYMLYLLETPSVVGPKLTQLQQQQAATNVSAITCDSRVLSRLINPHGYRIFPFLRPAVESIPVRLAPVDMVSSHPSQYPRLSSFMNIEDVPKRLEDKRKSGKRKMTTISCYNGQLRCLPIVCDLGKLSYKAGPITLEFIARLWDNTMRQDFKDIFLTKLHISATWRADVKYAIDLGDSDHALEKVELSIFNNLEPKPVVPKYMILYIGLAVFGGVLLLAILIIILKKAGFFKRKRFIRRPRRGLKDETDSRSRGTNQPVGTDGNQSRIRDPLLNPKLRASQVTTTKNPSRNLTGFQPLQPDSSYR